MLKRLPKRVTHGCSAVAIPVYSHRTDLRIYNAPAALILVVLDTMAVHHYWFVAQKYVGMIRDHIQVAKRKEEREIKFVCVLKC